MLRRAKIVRHLIILLAIAASNPALARHGGDDDKISHEMARQLLESGRIRPLEDIVAKVLERVPGKLIETELESEHGRIIYDIKILRPEGRVQEVEVDAATGEILKIEDDD